MSDKAMPAKSETLHDYIQAHTIRGSCTCGRCADAPGELYQPTGHTAELVFFRVAAKDNPDSDALRKLCTEHKSDYESGLDLFDNKEHSYLQIGAWIGDQGLALMLMGLGSLLGLWKLLTPVSMLRLPPDDPLAREMAGIGYVAIQAVKKEAANGHS